MSKLVPHILRDYTVELADPDAEWKLSGYWFVKQENFICKLMRRFKG
jgi:hypothetical protein